MVESKQLNKTKENEQDIIRIICLNEKCNKTFKVKSNGRRLYHYGKYDRVKKYKGEILSCPHCGKKKLRIKINE